MTSNLPPFEARRISVGDIELQVRIDGADGPWVILSHALGADHTLWDATAAHLAGRYRVLRYDIRGHGKSGAPVGPYTMTRLADDVVALMDALEVPQAHFVGLSLGGMIGQTLGVRHPERLLSLTLADTTRRTPMEAHPMWHERIGHAEAHGMAGVVDGALQRWLTAPWRASHPGEVERIRRMVLATPVHGYVGACLAILEYDLDQAIGRIHCPTLVVVGEQDQGTPVAEAEAIASAIPGARLEIVPEAAHLPPVEQPARFGEILDGFLGRAACGTQCDTP
ncbi:3-oxoadipate enol-lactonase [Cupriavidus respiraculi]|uniref:3-oxoadipate enol-lactonase n=1 Tax=Cupriavidus respiraculi TaxID=195930 RepID=UPI001C97B4B3|nr:3-oxoadipate enol-lactonase [Cupriavidus respiraculi]MBY4946360.1 3-oxoadipate enol-lactonase [Cupriavidus respiraculi]